MATSASEDANHWFLLETTCASPSLKAVQHQLTEVQEPRMLRNAQQAVAGGDWIWRKRRCVCATPKVLRGRASERSANRGSEVRAMKMDVTELTFDQLEELIARLERVSTGAVIQRNGARLELKVG